MKQPNKKAVILLSGGVDSSTTLAIATSEGFETFAMSFQYGQRHSVEIESARKIAAHFKAARHEICRIDLRAFGGSALTADIDVPKDRGDHEISIGVPVTYVPARNTIFLSYALAWAEVLQCAHIFIGVTAMDYSGYPDCRPEYIDAFEKMANLATKASVEDGLKVRIHAPLIQMKKSKIIRKGVELGVDYSLTSSCYDPDPRGVACGRCDSCRLRRKGFEEARIPDPTIYSNDHKPK